MSPQFTGKAQQIPSVQQQRGPEASFSSASVLGWGTHISAALHQQAVTVQSMPAPTMPAARPFMVKHDQAPHSTLPPHATHQQPQHAQLDLSPEHVTKG